MASFNYYLKGQKDSQEFKRSTKEVIVSLFVSYAGCRPSFATGYKVAPCNWDFKRKKVKSSATNSASINTFLAEFQAKVEKALLDLSSIGSFPAPETLKAEIAKRMNRDTNRLSLAGAFDRHMDSIADRIAERTIKNLKRNRNRIADYEKATGIALHLDTLTTDKAEGLLEWLSVKKNFSKNTIADMAKTIKSVVKWCDKVGLVEGIQVPEIKVSWEDVPNVYLNPDELEQLHKLDLSQKPSLDRVRDLFLVGCWTGLRFSDFTRLRPENIRGGNFTIQTMKTGEVVDIPIHPVVDSILTKYQGQLPKSISNQKMNVYIKEVVRLAGIDTASTKSITRADKKQTGFQPKFERVSTHTARRSFATNHYNAGMSPQLIMVVTGHKTESAFHKYIKVAKEDAATKLRQLWANDSRYSNIKVV